MDIQRIVLKKNIVVLGAGFGGIACVLRLEKLMRKYPAIRKTYNLVLVDKRNYHLYTPTLYDVATTAADDASSVSIKKAVATPTEEILERKNIQFVQGHILGTDIKEKKVLLDDAPALPYEYLVFALGSEAAHFNIPGIKEHAISLKWLDDAIHIRSTIRRKYEEKAEQGELAIVVGGGGPTGVEFSAELSGYIKELNLKFKKAVKLIVTIVEGSPTILPGFDLWTVTKAHKRLTALGIHLKTGCMVSGANDKAVFVKPSPDAAEEGIPYDSFIWSGGVQAVNVLSNGGVSVEKRGRMETDSYMTCISPDKHLDIAKNIFAIGDNACFYDPETHRPVAATARLAIEQGKVAAQNIFRDLLGKPRKAFTFWHYPYVIPLGGKYALAKIGPVHLEGLLAWAFHEFVELYYLWSITNDNWKALARWWRGLEIFSKND